MHGTYSDDDAMSTQNPINQMNIHENIHFGAHEYWAAK